MLRLTIRKYCFKSIEMNMFKKKNFSFLMLCVALLLSSCATKKKKGDVGWLSQKYHDTTAKYNGYFNANELLKQSFVTLNGQHQDNYNNILEVYPYVAAENPKAVSADLDKAIEKVATVATLHEPSKWVDDCYVLMGKAQFLKQDYETAEETLEYFQEEFDPLNPFGRVYDKNKSKKRAKKLKEKQKKEEREDKKKAKEEEKKEKEKAKEERRKIKEKEKKEREKAKKKRARDKKKKKKKGKKSRKDRPQKESSKTESKTVKDVPKTNATKELNKTSKPAKKTSEDSSNTSKKKKERVSNYPDASGGGFKHKPAFYEGVLWLSKTYIERDKFTYAIYLLDKLENEYPVSDKVKRELPAVRARMLIRQGKYDLAIPQLEQAMRAEKNKRTKARYAFIMAQIYQKQGDYTGALSSFESVKKYNPDFVMEFNAMLNIYKGKLQTGTASRENTIKKLDKLLKEDKYAQFRDQVYFTRGEIKLLDNDTKGAIEDFQTSIRLSSGNKNQKAEAYYKLGQLYYGQESYVEAKSYLDSTLMSLNKNDERHFEVKTMSDNLTGIVTAIKIISLQDSLLRISEMSKEDQRVLAARLLKEQRENNEKLGQTETEDQSDLPSRPGIPTAGNSKFFAYNLSSKVKGKLEFKNRWGNIGLEDDWRRSAGSNSSAEEGGESSDLTEESAEEETDITDAQVRRILKEVPNSPPKKEKANELVRKAMFDLGRLYRDKIANYKKSVDVLGDLETRYPGQADEAEAFYYQYLSYGDLNNKPKEEEYRNKVSNGYPESTYGQLLNDPDFINKFLAGEQKVDRYYSEAYDQFNAGNYNQALEMIKGADEQFGEKNKIKAKFALLRAMCVGNIEGKDAYIEGLKLVSTKFPNTPEDKRAKEIRRFLKGDQEAFKEALYEEAKEDFEANDEGLHYIIAVIYEATDAKKREAKIQISNYNKKYHKLDRLRITDIYLNAEDKTQIILVRKFKGKEPAMKYLDGVEKNKSDYIDEDLLAYDLFAVTQKNYREIVKQRSINSYRTYFKKTYLDK